MEYDKEIKSGISESDLCMYVSLDIKIIYFKHTQLRTIRSYLKNMIATHVHAYTVFCVGVSKTTQWQVDVNTLTSHE